MAAVRVVVRVVVAVPVATDEQALDRTEAGQLEAEAGVATARALRGAARFSGRASS